MFANENPFARSADMLHALCIMQGKQLMGNAVYGWAIANREKLVEAGLITSLLAAIEEAK